MKDKNCYIPNVLSIAGSDPSGGAGIQADLKSFAANKTFGMSVITALTAQNTMGVQEIYLVPEDFIESQINSIFQDITVDAVKIGMMANSSIASIIFKNLRKRNIKNIVIDPVMVAKGGATLLEKDAIETIRRDLIQIADVLTPNLPEAALLINCDIATTKSEMLTQGRHLLDLGPKAVYIKGGHLNSKNSPDLLITRNDEIWYEAERIKTINTHGTGCTLSSAICANLAHGLDIEIAISNSKQYVTDAIENADKLNVGQGHGPTHHFNNLW
jgi:hydroxymethylpyrimidine kinase/phosphomethylpyrimidine kinase